HFKKLTKPTLNMKKYVLMCLLMGFVISFATAQIQISGNVTDASEKLPLPGVSVLIKGTSTGTVTDIDGKYTLSIPSQNSVLVFSFIGYGQQEVTVNDRTIIDVVMEEESQGLNEVVVTALGIEREKRALAYSVSEVKGDEFTRARETN